MNTYSLTKTHKKSFSREAREFLESLIRQRVSLVKNNKSRQDGLMVTQATDTISRYLKSYYYNDEQMAAFICRHISTIRMIMPGEGSGCHQTRLNDLLGLYNRALSIKTTYDMRKYSYYLVTNDYGKAYVKTSVDDCTIASMSFEGKPSIRHFETNYKKTNGDIASEITKAVFISGLKTVIEKIKKENGL